MICTTTVLHYVDTLVSTYVLHFVDTKVPTQYYTTDKSEQDQFKFIERKKLVRAAADACGGRGGGGTGLKT